MLLLLTILLLLLATGGQSAKELDPVDPAKAPFHDDVKTSPGFSKTLYKDHSFTAHKQDWLLENEKGVIDAFHTRLVNANEGAGCVVVDVGVNAGFYSLMSASYGCTVYGFELQRDCIDVTMEAASRDDATSKIHLFRNPVSDVASTMDIKYDDSLRCDGNFGFTREDCPWCDFHKLKGERKFNSTTLDDAFLYGAGKERAITKDIDAITLIKIDVEGHDVQVVKGALSLFQRKMVKNLIIETVPGMWPTPSRDDPDKSKFDKGKKVYRKLLEHGYSARCLTFRDPGDSRDNDKIAKKIFTKEQVDDFQELMLKGVCIDWLYELMPV